MEESKADSTSLTSKGVSNVETHWGPGEKHGYTHPTSKVVIATDAVGAVSGAISGCNFVTLGGCSLLEAAGASAAAGLFYKF